MKKKKEKKIARDKERNFYDLLSRREWKKNLFGRDCNKYKKLFNVLRV